MLNWRFASKEDTAFFIEDYLNRLGKDKELAEKYAIACIDIHRSILLYNDKIIIGAITWTIKEGIASGLVEIFQMSIPDKSYRGKGYGNILLMLCLEDIENTYKEKGYLLRRIFIVINEENLAGRNIYRKNQFKVLLEIKDHLKTGKKSFVYAKDYF